MSACDDGGSAFPNDGRWANDVAEGGMSLRDYFAAAALQGFLAGMPSDIEPGERASGIARDCYAIADAMLAERAK